MAIEKQKTYLVLNYNQSPVSILTKDNSYLVDGGTIESPSVLPLTIEEIITANSNGYAFKYGFLWFEKEYEEDIYKELRINNWESILTDSEIEEILVSPTKEGLEKLIAIDNEIYFNRVIGVYAGLKSIFTDISTKVSLVIEQRKTELKENKRKSEIVISKVNTSPDIPSQEVNDLKLQNELLLKQMEEMKQMFAQMQTNTQPKDENKSEISEEEKVKKAAGRPPKNK